MTTWQLSRSVAFTLTLALIAGVLTGCGGSNPPDSAGGSPSIPVSPSATGPGKSTPATPSMTGPGKSTPATRSTTGLNNQKDPDEGFAWAPWGPASPADPPPSQWYGNLERRNCAGLRSAVADVPGRELWRALAAVCDAAIGGDKAQWQVAQNAARAVPTGSDPGCLERAARALLKRALDWYERNPGRQPAVRFPAVGSNVACAFRIETVRVVDVNGQPLGGPLEGPVAGGTLLAISGQGIDEPTEIRIGGRRAEIEANISVEPISVERAIVVRTPGADKVGAATIRLRNRAGEVVAMATFRYVEPSGGPS